MPTEHDALLDAARRAHEAGDLEAAIRAYDTVAANRGEDPKLLYLLGNLHLECGRAQAAIAHLEKAVARQRNHPAILGSLAQAYFAAERYADAENHFRKASRADPRAVPYQVGLANALAMQQKFTDAETLLKRVVARHPDAAYAWLNLGNVARDQSRFEEAVAHYREALRCDSNLLDARNNLGSALHTLLRFEEAEAEYRACIVTDPRFLLARSNLASVLIDLGRFDEAEAQCRDMLTDDPAFAHAHAMLAAAISSQGRLSEALPHHREAARLAPQTTRFVTAFAAALCEAGDIDEGLRRLGGALNQHDETLPTTQLATTILLANGFLGEGWNRYRQRQTFLRIDQHFPQLKLRQSLPRALEGCHVGVVCEQGLGDELFFLRFVPQLKAQCARITYCTSPKLAPLLARVPQIDARVSAPDEMPACDVTILVGDLPHALHEAGAPPAQAVSDDAEPGTLLHDFPWQGAPCAPLPPPSLRIPPLAHALAQVQQQLAAAGPPPYLAVTWRGGTAPEKQRGVEWKLFKEIGIAALGQALRAWPGTLLALQRHPAEGELGAMQDALGRPLADFTALNDDLEQMLALLGAIDEYVGVSNTNMHLRAAAGRHARVLVPCPAEWRWMASGASPWFPGFGVYRQSFDGRWDEALAQLRRDLAR